MYILNDKLSIIIHILLRINTFILTGPYENNFLQKWLIISGVISSGDITYIFYPPVDLKHNYVTSVNYAPLQLRIQIETFMTMEWNYYADCSPWSLRCTYVYLVITYLQNYLPGCYLLKKNLMVLGKKIMYSFTSTNFQWYKITFIKTKCP